MNTSKPLHFQSALQIAGQIASRRITSREVTQYFLDRIARSHKIHAFTIVANERALAQADIADAMVANGEPLSPLHGVPIAIKDSIEWEGTTIAAGSLSRLSNISKDTSTVVQKILNASMVVIGKTQMTEFAFGLSGQNTTMGTPWNPWNAVEHRAPGGSSSGAAVAVAAGLVPIALGGDTGGSVRAPAAMNHLVGFKPSSGLISNAYTVALSPSLDVLGPVCRTVEDAHVLTTILAGPDPKDPATLAIAPGMRHNFAAPLKDPQYKAFVLDKSSWPVPLSSHAEQIWDAALTKLQNAGWQLQNWTPSGDLAIGKLSDDNSLILSYESYKLYGNIATDANQPLWDIVRNRILSGGKIDDQTYSKLLKHRCRLAALFQAAIGIDTVVLLPAMDHGAYALDHEDVAHTGLGKFMRASNFLGTPAISLPSSFDNEGMPIGIQCMASPLCDKTLLDHAAVIARVVLQEDRNPNLASWGL